jgi:hyperosmotically inducible periplasmic protein
MKKQPDLRNVALVVALTAVAATAWATNESLMSPESVAARNSSLQPPPASTQPPSATTQPAPAPLPVSETLAPGEEIVAPAEPSAPAPAVRASAPQPPVIVEERHLTLDERIQADVMDKLAAAPHISGKIGVESHDAIVRLTGYTLTAGQAYRAGRYAGSVIGVRFVQNEIRPRIGGSI